MKKMRNKFKKKQKTGLISYVKFEIPIRYVIESQSISEDFSLGRPGSRAHIRG